MVRRGRTVRPSRPSVTQRTVNGTSLELRGHTTMVVLTDRRAYFVQRLSIFFRATGVSLELARFVALLYALSDRCPAEDAVKHVADSNDC